MSNRQKDLETRPPAAEREGTAEVVEIARDPIVEAQERRDERLRLVGEINQSVIFARQLLQSADEEDLELELTVEPEKFSQGIGLLEKIRTQAEAIDGVLKSLKEKITELQEEVGAMDLVDDHDLRSLNRKIAEIKTLIAEYQKNIKKRRSLTRRHKEVRRTTTQIMCAQAEVERESEVFTKIWKLKDEAGALKRGFLFGWIGIKGLVNRAEISRLNNQADEMQKMYDQRNEARELYEANYDLEKFLDWNGLSSFEGAQAKIEMYYADRLGGARLKIKDLIEERGERSVETEVDPEKLDLTLEALVRKELLRYHEIYPGITLAMEEELVRVVMEYKDVEFRGRMIGWGEPEAARERRAQASQAMDRLSHRVKGIAERILHQGTLKEIKKLLKIPEIVKAQRDYQTALTEARLINRELSNDPNRYRRGELDRELQAAEKFNAMEGINLGLWGDLKDLPEFRELLGPEVVEEAENILVETICQEFLTTREHTDRSVELGYEMLKRDGARFLEYNILNAWREPGHSGERPFLSFFEKGSQTAIYKYVARQEPEVIAEVSRKNPAVGRIIELMLENPDTFHKTSLPDPEASPGEYKFLPNPIDVEIRRLLGQATNGLLEGEREAEHFFATGLCRREGTFGNSPEATTRLEKIYERTSNQDLKDQIFDAATDSLRMGDSKEGLLFLARQKETFTKKLLDDLKYYKDRILGKFFVYPDDAEVRQAIGILLELSEEEILRVISVYQEFFVGQGDALGEERFEAAYIRNVEKLIKLVKENKNLEALSAELKKIREVDPDFKYGTYDITDDYDLASPFILFCQKIERDYLGSNKLKILQEHLAEAGEIPTEFSKYFLRALRERDPALREVEGKLDIAEDFDQAWKKALEDFLTFLGGPEISPEEKYFFGNINCLYYLSRQPEHLPKVLGLKKSCPKLFDLMAPGGPLESNSNNVIRDIFSNGNVEARAKEIESIFTRKIPYWEQLYFYTEARLGVWLADSSSPAPVREIEGSPWREISPEHLITLIADEEIRSAVSRGELDQVPFHALHGMAKRGIYRERIRATVERSRDTRLKEEAGRRNRSGVQSELIFEGEQRANAHGAPVQSLGAILSSGNLPRESLGADCSTDAFAFHVDFWKINPEAEALPITNIPELISKTDVNIYGGNGSGVILIYDRSRPGAYLAEGEIPGRVQGELHSVLLGGMPSTELQAIVSFRESNNAEVIRQIVENGFYIPVYDTDGKLIFTPQNFDEQYEEMNYQVPVETWDFTMKVGAQLGSNPGGVYAVPGEEGPVRYYVKLNREREDASRTWNEQLTDNIYKHLGLAVPETQVVKIGENYGHASRWMEQDDDQKMADFKDGFLADCLLANWDIVFERNRAAINGKTHRMDNGGALLFRARGERREGFNGIVTELETMRSSYPDLTEDDLGAQLLILRERFTDQDIEQLVEGVRLSKKDRQVLKQVLRERRDYILKYVESLNAPEQELPAAGIEIYNILQGEMIDDQALMARIPEWERLNGEEGFQHNGVLLGEHIKDAITTLKSSPEFTGLNPREQNLAGIAMLFHDFGKPTGRTNQQVPRDFNHEIPSAAAAAEYMTKWGYGPKEIRLVTQVINYDGIVSDIARGKVREKKNNLTPEQLKSLLGKDPQAIRILQAINKADVIATVGASRYEQIAPAYEDFFEKMLAE